MAFRGATAKDLAEFRIAFESDNARWAVRQATAEDRVVFRELVEEVAAASGAEQPDWRVIGGSTCAGTKRLRVRHTIRSGSGSCLGSTTR